MIQTLRTALAGVDRFGDAALPHEVGIELAQPVATACGDNRTRPCPGKSML